MNVLALAPLRSGSILFRLADGRQVLSFAAKCTYALTPGEVTLAPAELQQPVHARDKHLQDNPNASVYAPNDLVPIKPLADVVLVGSAFAPAGKPQRSVVARLAVAGIDRSVEVHGKRVRLRDGSIRGAGAWSKASLEYERAAGGTDTWNPVGISPAARPDAYGQRPTPSLLPPGHTGSVLPPVGFGPISATWMLRRERLPPDLADFDDGNYASVTFGDTFDTAYFQCAPPGQQVEALSGGDDLVLENLHPSHPHLLTRLPAMTAQAVLELHGRPPLPLDMRCDTLWIDTDLAVLSLVWRGQVPPEHSGNEGRVVIALGPTGQALDWAPVLATLPRLAAPAASAPLPSSPRTGSEGRPAAGGRNPTLVMAAPVSAARHRDDEHTAFTRTAPAHPAPVFPAWLDRPPGAPEPRSELAAPSPPQAPSVRLPPDTDGLTTLPLSQSAANNAPPWLPGRNPPVASEGGSTASSRASSPDLARASSPDLTRASSPDLTRASSPDLPRMIHDATPPTPVNGLAALTLGQIAAGAPIAAAAPTAAEPAADAPSRELPPSKEPRSAPSPRLTPVEIIWFDSSYVPRMHKVEAWKPLMNKALPADPKELKAALETSRETLARAAVQNVINRGTPVTPAQARLDLLATLQAETGTPVPLVLMVGEIQVGFDPLEALRVVHALAEPLAPQSKLLRDALALADEALRSPLEAPPPTLAGIQERIRKAWSAANRTLPANHIDTRLERLMIERRAFLEKRLLDERWACLHLSTKGGDERIPFYLPWSAGGRLPMFRSFPARVVGEVIARQDQYETSPIALRGVLLGRPLTDIL